MNQIKIYTKQDHIPISMSKLGLRMFQIVDEEGKVIGYIPGDLLNEELNKLGYKMIEKDRPHS
jgi:hypothetical protein